MDPTLKVPCLLIRQWEYNLLLPTACVAEILKLEPAEADDSRPWRLGSANWRGQQIDIIDFTALAHSDSRPLSGERLCAVLKAAVLGEESRTLALSCAAPPEIIVASERTIESDLKPKRLHPLALSYVRIDGQSALIPDLDGLAAQLFASHA